MSTVTSSPSISDRISVELNDLIAIRRDLHAHPELGYHEHRTSDVVKRELAKAGVAFVDGLAGGTGVLAHLQGKSDHTVGLRADMDALPIAEETGLPYASKTAGVMHACGHDGHTTMLIGAARVLAIMSRERGLPHPVSFVFQPAEEGGGGGRRMVEDDCLKGTRLGTPVTRMFGLHGWPDLDLGKVGTRPGAFLAAADNFVIQVRGAGCHAAYPHIGRDPILAASAIVTALQSIVSRNVDPLDSVVVSVTKFHGGTAHNVIPETVELEGTFRTLSNDMRRFVPERMMTVAATVAAAHGCTAEFIHKPGYPVTMNDARMVDFFNDVATRAIGRDRVQPIERPVMGAEDFAYYCNEVPSCFFALGLLPPGQKVMPTLHHPKFDFDDRAIALGVEMFVRLATS